MTPARRQATELERAVLTALGAKGSIKEAAHSLGISERTARRRLARLCARLDVESPIQAAFVLWGGDRGQIHAQSDR